MMQFISLKPFKKKSQDNSELFLISKSNTYLNHNLNIKVKKLFKQNKAENICFL